MQRARRIVTIVCALALVAAGIGVAGWTVTGSTVAWQSAGPDGDTPTIAVSYVGSSCMDHRSVKIDETDSAITVTVIERSFRPWCSDEPVDRHAFFIPKTELGERDLLDGSCDEPSRCVRPFGTD